MKTLFDILLSAVLAYVFMLIITPLLRKLAIKIELVDKPNVRKVHTSPVPMVGGISIIFSVCMTLLVTWKANMVNTQTIVIIGSSALLLIISVIDDRFDISALYRLLIQLSCAYAVATSGIRITNLYGILGITEIPLMVQYILTIIVITGVVNAFNLMDGIDGLAGSLALTGFSALTILSFVTNQIYLACLYTAFIGALIGFLKFNFGNQKTFMGDAGSVVLGFILACSAIHMLNQPLFIPGISSTAITLAIISIFIIPVFDSLRVYRSRIKSGQSPFKADKSHMHHLLLQWGASHKTASMVITLFSIVIILLAIILGHQFQSMFVLPILVLLFNIITRVLNLNTEVQQWKTKLSKLEN